MKLTGKCKKDFEEWFKENTPEGLEYLLQGNFPNIEAFIYISTSMQWGVLVDFFDSKDIFLSSERYWDLKKLEWSKDYYWCSANLYNSEQNYDGYSDSDSARISAIEKANEIYNAK